MDFREIGWGLKKWIEVLLLGSITYLSEGTRVCIYVMFMQTFMKNRLRCLDYVRHQCTKRMANK